MRLKSASPEEEGTRFYYHRGYDYTHINEKGGET